MLKAIIRDAKRWLLRMHYESGVGHIGCNLSCLDLLPTLHHQVMSDDDQFVLSKCRAAGALYTTLWSKQLIADDDLRSFHKDHTKLAGQPPTEGLPGILLATGSLGHGPGLAAGLALGKRLQGKPGRVCLTSDGEWNEGSTWEAVRAILQYPERDFFLRGIRAAIGFKQTGVDYVRPERWAKKGILSFSYVPLSLLSFVATILLLSSVGLGLLQVVLRLLFSDSAPKGAITLLLVILLFGSINLMGIATVGEYIAKILEETKRRPHFIRRAIIRGGEVRGVGPT